MDYKIIEKEELVVGMQIARDIISFDGIFLVPSNTTITPGHIKKILTYPIKNIFIYLPKDELPESITDPNILISQQESLSVPDYTPMDETAAFIEFSLNYEQQLNIVEQQLSQIVNTGDINTSVLDTIATDIRNTAIGKTQLFSHMFRLRSSDNHTFNHCLNVSIFASILGKWLHLSKNDIRQLSISGLLHDIGKTKVNQDILNKKSTLTKAEFAHLKNHTTLGYDLISLSDLPIAIKQVVLMHHERMDGSGYPLGLSYANIHPYARIIAIVDIYDAITSDRPYHKRMHPFKVIKMLEEDYYHLLDTKYLYVFLEHIAYNFLGDQVRLSNGDKGKIIFINKSSPSSPLIQTSTNSMIDLMTRPDITISAFI